MSKSKKWTNAEVAGAVESEGLGYAVQHYLSAAGAAYLSGWNSCVNRFDAWIRYAIRLEHARLRRQRAK